MTPEQSWRRMEVTWRWGRAAKLAADAGWRGTLEDVASDDRQRIVAAQENADLATAGYVGGFMTLRDFETAVAIWVEAVGSAIERARRVRPS